MRVFWSQVVLITICGVVVSATIIVIEDAKACFRRVLAAKRVSRAFVKKSMTCETVEECQQECAAEKRFICEGFNYRLDPTGRGKGDCELLDCPLSQLDLRRDILPDPNYDYYERDRNAVECERRRPQNRYGGGGYNGYGGYGVRSGSSYGGSYGSSWTYNSYTGGDDRRYNGGSRVGGNYYADRRYDYDDDRQRPGDRWSDSDRPRRPYLPPSNRPSYYGASNNRRGDHSNYPPHDRKIPDHISSHYLPPTKPQYGDTDRIIFQHEGISPYLPPKVDTFSDWGLYNKGNQAYSRYGGYNYWYNKYNNEWKPIGSYPPENTDDETRPPYGGTQLVPSGPESTFDNHITPIVPSLRQPHRYDYKRDECSLRMASGFKLHKTVVGRLFSVQNIYECEYLCFKEKGFLCSSYAYRYTLPADNCYLSPKNYKELNYYTDLEPDRDFDIYTMSNRDKCAASIGVRGGDSSECFLRVRSGKRLDESVAKDSLTTKSAVECQIECLKASRFTCRAFSFRYGPPVFGGVIDNCQLTDCPFYELDPRNHFVSEAGFEIYERASFGHGCQPDHLIILTHGNKNKVPKMDQLCYVGFGTPARLLPQAVRKAVYVPSEIECKQECSKFRHGTLFQCMSFSFRSGGSKFAPNCHLSDILQRDLLQDIDYVYDPNCKVFAWDNFSPDCVAIIYETGDTDNHLGYGGEMDHKHDTSYYGLDTWKVYSVSGWPCRRDSSCIENTEAGFWYCELEGAENNGWDYCCRPDHQCGASYEFPYQWCYVGPDRTQWRKCSDSYYPYIRHLIDERADHHKPYYPPNETGGPPGGLYPPPPFRPGARPDRPPAPPLQPLPAPSLSQYEHQFDDEFLSLKPPKLPVGLSQSRHWPISYLHKEMPPNITYNESQLTKDNPKYQAIQSLINVIKNKDLQNLEYHISNESKSDDILLVRIPLPANFTRDAKNSIQSNTSVELAASESKRSPKSSFPPINEEGSTEFTPKWGRNSRRGFVTRTNVTSHGRQY